MWRSKQFLCEMVNDLFVYDLELKERLDGIVHEYGESSRLEKVFLDVTNRCNIQCLHCFTNANSAIRDELTTAEVKALIDDLAGLGIDRLALGGGEPLCRRDIYELIEYSAARGIRVHISSNGLLLTSERLLRLKKCGLDSVQISIDSSRPEQHDHLRQKRGLHAICLDAISRVRDAGLTLLISTTVTSLNIDELEDIVEMVRTRDVQMHRFIRFVPVGRGEANIGTLYVDGAKLRSRIHELHTTYAEYYYGDPDYVYGIPFNGRGVGRGPGPDAQGCEAGRISVDILPNGDVVPCNYLGITPRWVCGNIRSEAFADIARRVERQNTLRSLPGSGIEGCSSCSIAYRCGKGCRAVSYKYYGALEARDPVCPGIKE